MDTCNKIKYLRCLLHTFKEKNPVYYVFLSVNVLNTHLLYILDSWIKNVNLHKPLIFVNNTKNVHKNLKILHEGHSTLCTAVMSKCEYDLFLSKKDIF